MLKSDEDMGRIYLGLGKDKWRPLVETVMNLWITQKAEIFLVG
jgi:hypothetical protein